MMGNHSICTLGRLGGGGGYCIAKHVLYMVLAATSAAIKMLCTEEAGCVRPIATT